MHRLACTVAVLAVLTAVNTAAQAQSPQAPAPNPPAKSPPPTYAATPQQPTAAPPAQGQWVWQPAPQQPVQAISTVAVPQPIQYVQPVQQAVYAVPQPVQATYQTVQASAPITVQLGGGFLSAGLTHVGQKLVTLGSTRTTLTLQRQRTLVGMPMPSTTYSTMYTVNQPVQTQYVVQQVPVQQQLVGQPPAAGPPPSEAAPPPPTVPHGSPQSGSGSTGQGPRRIGLLDGIFGGSH